MGCPNQHQFCRFFCRLSVDTCSGHAWFLVGSWSAPGRQNVCLQYYCLVINFNHQAALKLFLVMVLVKADCQEGHNAILLITRE
jgi:hypothetical protein